MVENEEVPITQDERTMATLAHALQVAGWWIAPLIIYWPTENRASCRFMLSKLCFYRSPISS